MLIITGRQLFEAVRNEGLTSDPLCRWDEKLEPSEKAKWDRAARRVNAQIRPEGPQRSVLADHPASRELH